MANPPDPASAGAREDRWRFPRPPGLWYLLISSYLVVSLVLHRMLSGGWELDAELLARAVVVSLAQLVVLLPLARWVQHRRGRGT